MNYSVNIESLQKNFPEGFEVPALLLDFGDWLKAKRDGSVGYFCLQSERFNDFWIENGADLHPFFAFFMRDPSGGQIGFWLYDGRATALPPIVVVGSEGALGIVSDTVAAFLTRLAEGNTGVSDLDSREKGGSESAELAAWLDSCNVATPPASVSEHPKLSQWIDEWGQKQRDWINADFLHMQIAERLRKFVKPNAKPWETANFDVLLVGTQFRMWHRSFGPKPMPQNEVADLEELFRSVREQRAQKMPERGLWFTSWVKVGRQGGANLCCNFMEEPKILDEKAIIPSGDYDLDFRAFPRSTHWMPEWFKHTL